MARRRPGLEDQAVQSNRWTAFVRGFAPRVKTVVQIPRKRPRQADFRPFLPLTPPLRCPHVRDRTDLYVHAGAGGRVGNGRARPARSGLGRVAVPVRRRLSLRPCRCPAALCAPCGALPCRAGGRSVYHARSLRLPARACGDVHVRGLRPDAAPAQRPCAGRPDARLGRTPPHGDARRLPVRQQQPECLGAVHADGLRRGRIDGAAQLAFARAVSVGAGPRARAREAFRFGQLRLLDGRQSHRLARLEDPPLGDRRHRQRAWSPGPAPCAVGDSVCPVTCDQLYADPRRRRIARGFPRHGPLHRSGDGAPGGPRGQ